MDTNSRQNWSTPGTQSQPKHAPSNAAMSQAGVPSDAATRQTAAPYVSAAQAPQAAHASSATRNAHASDDARYAHALEHARHVADRAQRRQDDLTQNTAFGTTDKPEGFVATWKKATHTWRFRAVLCVFLALLLIMMQPTGNALYRSWNASNGEMMGLAAAIGDNGDSPVTDLALTTSSDITGVELTTADDEVTTVDYLNLGVNDLLVFYGDVNETTAPVIKRYVQDGTKSVTYTADGSPQTGAVATSASAANPQGQDYLPTQGTVSGTTLNPWKDTSASQGNYGAISSVAPTADGWSVPESFSNSPSNIRVTYDVVQAGATNGSSLPSPLWSLGYTFDAWWNVETSLLGPSAAQGYIFMPDKVGQSGLTLSDAVQSIYYPANGAVYAQSDSMVFASGVDGTGELKDAAYEATTTKSGGTYYDKWYYASWKPTRYTVEAWFGNAGAASRVWSSRTNGGATGGLLWTDPLNILPSDTQNGLLVSSDVTWVPVSVSGGSGSATLTPASYAGGVPGGYASSGGDESTGTTGYNAYDLFNPNSLKTSAADPAYSGVIVEDSARSDYGATLVSVAPAFTVTFHGDNGGAVTGSGAKSFPFLVSTSSELTDAYSGATFEGSSSVVILPYDKNGAYSRYCGDSFASFVSGLTIPTNGTNTSNYWKKNNWTSVHFVPVADFKKAAISQNLTSESGFQDWLEDYIKFNTDQDGDYWDLENNGKFISKPDFSLTAADLGGGSASANAGNVTSPATNDTDFGSYFTPNGSLELVGWNVDAARAAGESAGTMSSDGSTIAAGDAVPLGTLSGSRDLYAVWANAADATITWQAGTDSANDNAPTATVTGGTTTITPGTELADSDLPTVAAAAGYGGTPTWTKTVDGTTTSITSPVGETITKDTTFTVTYTKLDSRTVTFTTSNPSIAQVGVLASGASTPTALASTSVLDGATWSELKDALGGTLVLMPATATGERVQADIDAAFYAAYGHKSTIQSWNNGTSSGTAVTDETAFSADTTVVATPTPVYSISVNVGGWNNDGTAAGTNTSGTFAGAYADYQHVIISEVPAGVAHNAIYIDASIAGVPSDNDPVGNPDGTNDTITYRYASTANSGANTSFATLVSVNTGGVLASGATGTLGKYAPNATAANMNAGTADTTWTTGSWDTTPPTGDTTVTAAETYTYTFAKGLVAVLFSKAPIEAGGYTGATGQTNQYKDLSDSTLGDFVFDTGTGILDGGVVAPSTSATSVAGVTFSAPSNVEALYVPWGTAGSVFTEYGSSSIADTNGFPKIVKTSSAAESIWRTKYAVNESVNYTDATWALDTSKSTSSEDASTLPEYFHDALYVYEGTAPLADLHVKVLVKDATDQTTNAGSLMTSSGASSDNVLVLYDNPGTSGGAGGFTWTAATQQTLKWGDYASVLLTDAILQGPNNSGNFQYVVADEAHGWDDNSTRAWGTGGTANVINPATTQVTADNQEFYVTVDKKATTSVQVTINGGSVNGETGTYTITGVPVGTKLSDIVFNATDSDTEAAGKQYTFVSTTASDATGTNKTIDGTRTAETGYIGSSATDSIKKGLYDAEVGAVADPGNNVEASGWLGALEESTGAANTTKVIAFNFPIDYYDVTITFQKPTSLTSSTPIAANGAYLNVNTETSSSTNSFTIKNVPYYIRSGNTATATTLGQIKYKLDGSDWVYDADGTYTVPATPSGAPDGLTTTSATGWQKAGVSASTSTEVFTTTGNTAFTYTFALKSYAVEFVIDGGDSTWAEALATPSNATLSNDKKKLTISGLAYGDTISGAPAITNDTEITGTSIVVAGSGYGKNAGNASTQKVKGSWNTTPLTTLSGTTVTSLSGDTPTITYTFAPTQVDTITWQVNNGYFTTVAGQTGLSVLTGAGPFTEEVYRGESRAEVAVENSDTTVFTGPTWYSDPTNADDPTTGTQLSSIPTTTSGDVTYIANFARQQIEWQIIPHYQTVTAAKNNNAAKDTAGNWDTGTPLVITSDAGVKLDATSSVTPVGGSAMSLEDAIKSLRTSDGYKYVDFSDNSGSGSQTIAAYLNGTGFTPTTSNNTLDVYFTRNKYTLTLDYTFDGAATPGTGFSKEADGFAPTWTDSASASHEWTSPSGGAETFNNVVYGETIQSLASGSPRMVNFTLPTNNQYAFAWQDGTTDVSGVDALTMPASDKTYYGRWTRANTYTVAFYNDDTNKGTIAGETSTTVVNAQAEKVITGKWHDALTAPTVTGKGSYSNMFWTSEYNGTTAAIVPTTIAGDATFWTHYGTNTAVTYANDNTAGVDTTLWGAIDSSRLTFEGTSGRVATTDEKFGGTTGLDPADYAANGYIFDKWTVSPALSSANEGKFDETGGTNKNQPMQDGFVVDNSYTFTANYKRDVFKITYQQTLKAVGGDQTSGLVGTTTTFTKSTTTALAVDKLQPPIDNYTFDHYEITYGSSSIESSKFSVGDSAITIAADAVPEADITVTAVYVPVNYTVTWQFAQVSSENTSREYTNASNEPLVLQATSAGATAGVTVASGGQTVTLSAPYGTSYTDLMSYVTVPTDAKYDGIDWSIDPSGSTVSGATTLDGAPQIRSYTVTVAMDSLSSTGTLSAGDKSDQTSIPFTATYGQTVGDAQYKYNSGSSSAKIENDLTITAETHYNAADYLVTASPTAAVNQSNWKNQTVTGDVTYTITLLKKRYAVTFGLIDGQTTYDTNQKASGNGITDSDAKLAYTALSGMATPTYYVESGDDITMPGLVAETGKTVVINDKYNGLTWLNTKDGGSTYTKVAGPAASGDATTTLSAGDTYSDGQATTVTLGDNTTKSVVGTITLKAFTSLITHSVTVNPATGTSMKSGYTSPLSVGYGENVIAAVIAATQPDVGYAQDASLVKVTVGSTDYASDGTLAMGTSNVTAAVSYPKLHKVTLEMPKGSFTPDTSTGKYANNDTSLVSGRDKANTTTYIELYVADGKKLSEYYTLYKAAGQGNLVAGSNTFVTPVSSGTPTGYTDNTGQWQTTSTWASNGSIGGELANQEITADTTFYYVYKPTTNNKATVNVFYQNASTPTTAGVAGTAADYYTGTETQPVADQTFTLDGLTFDTSVNVADLLTAVGNGTNAAEGNADAITTANTAKKILVPVGFKAALANHSSDTGVTNGVASTATYEVSAATGTINVYLDRETLNYTYQFLGDTTTPRLEGVTPPSASNLSTDDKLPAGAQSARYGETVTLWTTDNSYNGTVNGVSTNMSFLGWVKDSVSETPFFTYTFDSANVTYSNGAYTPATTAFGGIWGTKVYKTTVRLLNADELTELNGSLVLSGGAVFASSEYDNASDAFTKLTAGGNTTTSATGSIEVKTAASTAIAEPTHEFSTYNPNYTDKSDDHAKYEILGWVAKHKATAADVTANYATAVDELTWDRDNDGAIKIYTATNGALGVTAIEDGQVIMPIIQVKSYTVTFTGGAHGTDPTPKTDTATVSGDTYQYGTQFTLKYGDPLPYAPAFASTADYTQNIMLSSAVNEYGFDSNGYVVAKSTEEARAWKTPITGVGTATRVNWEILGDNTKSLITAGNTVYSGDAYAGVPMSGAVVGGDINISWKWAAKTYTIHFMGVDGTSMQKLAGQEWTGNSGVTDVSTTINYTDSIFKNLLVSQYAVGESNTSSKANVVMEDGTTQSVTVSALTDSASKAMQLPNTKDGNNQYIFTALFDSTYNPTKPNATFLGWVAGTVEGAQQATPILGRDITVKDLYSASYGANANSATDLYVYATWQGNPSRIVFHTNFSGAANSGMSSLADATYTTTDVAVDEEKALPAVSTMTGFDPAGYDFDHWASDATGAEPTYLNRANFTPSVEYNATADTGGHDLYAVYTPHTYQVRWLKLDGVSYVTNNDVYEKYESALTPKGSVSGPTNGKYYATYTVAANTAGLAGISELTFIGTTTDPVNESTPYTQVFTYNVGSAFPEMGSLTGGVENVKEFRAWLYGNITVNTATFTGAGLIGDGATLTTLTSDSYTDDNYITLKAQPKTLVTLTLDDNNQKTDSSESIIIDLDEDLVDTDNDGVKDSYKIVRNTPTKSGYDFAGWKIGNDVYYSTKDASGNDQELESGQTAYIPKSVLTGGATGTGQWTTGNAEYTVEYYFEQTAGKKDYWKFTETDTGVTGTTAQRVAALGTNGGLTKAAGAAAEAGVTLRAADKYTAAAGSSTYSDTIQPDGSTTLKLYYNLKSYTATFNYLNQTFKPNPLQIKVVQGETLKLPTPGDGVMDAIPEGTGLNPNTYWLVGTTGATVNCGDEYVLTANTTFNMTLLPYTHEVTFELGEYAKWSDGKTDTTRTATAAKGSGVGDNLPAVEGPESTGYAFIGWTLSTRDSAEAAWVATTNIYSNDEVKAYAIYDDNVKFTANYKKINTITYLPGLHAAAGFGGATAAFDSIQTGWTYEEDGATRIVDNDTETADVRLGKMDPTALKGTYGETYFDNNGNPVAAVGWTFKEWVDQEGNAYNTLAALYAEAANDTNQTFTATYEPTEQAVVFQATPNSDHKPGPADNYKLTIKGKTATSAVTGTATDNVNATAPANGATAVAPAGPAAANAGYEFDYWQMDGGSAADTLEPGDEITFPATDVTYTAVYKLVDVEISFTQADTSEGMASDTTTMPNEVAVPAAGYDENGTAIAAPQNKALPKIGYHFSAWTPSTAIADFNAGNAWYNASEPIMSGDSPNPKYGLLTVQKVGGLYTKNTYTASFTRAEYTASFQSGDTSKGTVAVTTSLGTPVSPAKQTALHHGDKVTYKPVPTALTGYEFKGWTYVMQEEYITSDGSLAIREVKQTTPISTEDVAKVEIHGDTVFTAVFDKQQVQLTFDSNSGNKASGTAVAAITGESGQTGVALPNCTWSWAGHTFMGWSKNVAYDKYDASASPAQVIYQPGATVTMPTEGADTYYAVWQVHEVTVTYHNSATPMGDTSATGASYWYDQNKNSTTDVDINTYKFKSVPRDIATTEVASTETAAKSPAVVFSDDVTTDNTWGAPGYISSYADHLKIPGYAREFLGWSDTAGGQVLITPDNLVIPASMMPTAVGTDTNLDLYAIWSDKTYTITLNPGVAGQLKDGVTANDLVIGDKTIDPTTATITYGTTVEIPAAFTKFTYDTSEEEGYNYLGWTDNATPKTAWPQPTGTAFNDSASYVFRAASNVTLTASWQAKNTANAKLAVSFSSINPSVSLDPTPYQGLTRSDKPLADGKHEVTDPMFSLGGWYVARPVNNTIDLGDNMAQYKVDENATMLDILKKYYSVEGTEGRVSLNGTLGYNDSEAPAYVNADGTFTETYYKAVEGENKYVTIPLYRYQAIEQYKIKYLTEGYAPGSETYAAATNGTMADQTAKASEYATTKLATSGYAYDGYEFVGWVKAVPTRTYDSVNSNYSTTWDKPANFSVIQNGLSFTDGVATVGSGSSAVKVYQAGYTLQSKYDLLTEAESNQNISEVHLIAVWKAIPSNEVSYVLAYDGDGAANPEENAEYVYDSVKGLTWNDDDQVNRTGTLVYPGAKIDNTTYGSAPAPVTTAYPIEGYTTFTFMGWNTKADGTGVWLVENPTTGQLNLPYTGTSATLDDIRGHYATVKQVVEAMRALDPTQEPEAIMNGEDPTGAYKLTLYAQWSNQGRIVEYYGPEVQKKKGAEGVSDEDADYSVVNEAVEILKGHQKVKEDTTVDTTGMKDSDPVVGKVRVNDLIVKGQKPDGWTILNSGVKVTQALSGDTMVTTVPQASNLGAAGWVSKLRADFVDRTYNVLFENDTIAAVEGHAAPTVTANGNVTGIKWAEALYASDATDPVAEGYEFGGYTVTTPTAGKKLAVAKGATVKATAEAMLAADDTALTSEEVTDQADDIYGTDDASGSATQPKTYTLSAVWTPKAYSLTFNSGVADFKAGGKTATVSGKTWYDDGILFDEEAMTHPGYKDVKWYFHVEGKTDALAWSDASVDPTLGDLAAAYKAAYNETMPQTGVELRAQWTETTAPIVFTVSDTTRGQVKSGSVTKNEFSLDVGTVTGNVVEDNATVSITDKTFTAVPNAGYVVDGWYRNGVKVVEGDVIDLTTVTTDDDTIALKAPNGTNVYEEATYEARLVGDPATAVGVTFHFQDADGSFTSSAATTPVANDANAPTTLEASGGEVQLTGIVAGDFDSKTDEVISKVKLYSTAVGKLKFTIGDGGLQGFTYDDARTADLTVAADGSAVGDLYFTRTAADLHFKTYVEGGGAATPKAPDTRENVLYKHVETLPAAADAPTAPAGYTFDGWYVADASGNLTGDAITTFTMTLKDATIVGKYVPESVTATVLGVYALTDAGAVGNKIAESSIASFDPAAGTTVEGIPSGSTLTDMKRFVELQVSGSSTVDTFGYAGDGGTTLGKVTYGTTQSITWVYTVAGDDAVYTTDDPTKVALKANTTFYAITANSQVVLYAPGEHGTFTTSLNNGTRYEGIGTEADTHGHTTTPYPLADYPFMKGEADTPAGEVGWVFAGWHVRYIASDNNTIIDSSGGLPYTTQGLYNEFDQLYHSITITAAWEPGESQLAFDLNAPSGQTFTWNTTSAGKTTDPSGTYKTEQQVPLPTITATSADEEGWELTKWIATVDGVEYEYEPGSLFTMPAAASDATTTLKAVWTEKYVTVQYKATDAAMGDVSVGSEQIGVYTGRVKGTDATTVGSTATAKENYTFAQWHEGSPTGAEPAGVSGDNNETVVPQKVDGKYVATTYYAEFTGKQYNVKFSVDPTSVYPEGHANAGKPLGYIKDVAKNKEWESADGNAIVSVVYGKSVDLDVIDGVPYDGEAYADGKYWTWTMYEGQDTATGTATTGQVDRAGLAALPIKGYTELVVSFKHPTGNYIAEFWNLAASIESAAFTQRYSWSDPVSTSRTVERTGYDFTGWYVDVPTQPAKSTEAADYEKAPGNTALANQKYSVLAGGEYYEGGNVKLRAGWEMRAGYAVNFDANGGAFAGSTSTTVTTVDRTAAGAKITWSGDDSAVPVAGEPTWAGHEFLGWYTQPVGGDRVYVDETGEVATTSMGYDAIVDAVYGTTKGHDSVGDQPTLYAHWQETQYQVVYFAKWGDSNEYEYTTTRTYTIDQTGLNISAPSNSDENWRWAGEWRYGAEAVATSADNTTEAWTSATTARAVDGNTTIRKMEAVLDPSDTAFATKTYYAYGAFEGKKYVTTEYELWEPEATAATSPSALGYSADELKVVGRAWAGDVVTPNTSKEIPGFVFTTSTEAKAKSVELNRKALSLADNATFDDVKATVADDVTFKLAYYARTGYTLKFDLNDTWKYGADALTHAASLLKTDPSTEAETVVTDANIDAEMMQTGKTFLSNDNVPYIEIDTASGAVRIYDEAYSDPERPGFVFGGWNAVQIDDASHTNEGVVGYEPAAPGKSGSSTLYGWLARNADGSRYDPINNVDSALTLYAKWTELRRTVTYVVPSDPELDGVLNIKLAREDDAAFNEEARTETIGAASGDTFDESGARITANNQIGANAKVVKRGYHFTGWRVVGEEGKEYKEERGEAQGDAIVETAAIVTAATRAVPALQNSESGTVEVEADGYGFGFTVALTTAADDGEVSVLVSEGTAYTSNEHVTAGVTTDDGLFAGAGTVEDDESPLVVYVATAALNDKHEITFSPGDADTYTGVTRLSQPVGTYVGEEPKTTGGAEQWGVDDEGYLPGSDTISREGYIFNGWKANVDLTYDIVDSEGNVTGQGTVTAGTVIDPASDIAKHLVVPDSSVVFTADWTKGDLKRTVTVPPSTNPKTGEVVPETDIVVPDGGILTDEQIAEIVKRGDAYPDTWDVSYTDPDTGERVTKTMTVDELIAFLQTTPVVGDMTITVNENAKWGDTAPTIDPKDARVRPAKKSTAAKTGDTLPVLPFVASALVAALVLAIFLIRRRHQE